MAALLRLSRLRESLMARVVLKRPPLSVVSSTRPAAALYSGNGGDSGSKMSEDDLLPQYIPRDGESEAAKRARLLYQSRKRGMLENGLLLSTFASKYLDKLTPQQLDKYDDLINRPSNDWQLYYWMIGHEEPPARYDNDVMKMLKEHSRNEDRESRLRQPELKPMTS